MKHYMLSRVVATCNLHVVFGCFLGPQGVSVILSSLPPNNGDAEARALQGMVALRVSQSRQLQVTSEPTISQDMRMPVQDLEPTCLEAPCERNAIGN